MPIADLYSLGLINVNVTGGAFVLDQIKDQSINSNLTEFLAYGDGLIDPQLAAVLKQDPILNVTSEGVAKVLNALGLDGLDVTGGTGVDFYSIKRARTGAAASGSVHEKYNLTRGLIVPTRIEASQESASISMDVHAESADGITSPYGAPEQAAYALTGATAEAFVAGAIKIDSTVIYGVQTTSLDFGISVTKNWSDGDPYPTWCGVDGRKPTATIRTMDATVLRTLGLGGSRIQTACDIYLRKVNRGGTRVADATAEHIRFRAVAGLAVVRQLSARHGDKIEPIGAEILIYPEKDGVNDVIAIDTTAAIELS